MAAGDFHVFDKFISNIGAGIHNFDDTFTNGIKMGIITNTSTYTASQLQVLADPKWGTGTPDLSLQETIATSGNYTAGGENLTTTIADADVWTITASTVTLALDDVSIDVHASNPTGTGTSSAYWGIIYDDDATAKNAIGFVELGTGVDMTAGNFTITWDGAGSAAGKVITIAGSVI